MHMADALVTPAMAGDVCLLGGSGSLFNKKSTARK